MRPPIAPPSATPARVNEPKRRGAWRVWGFLALFFGVTGGIAAVIGDHMFGIESKRGQSSSDVVAQAGDWAILGFGGGFLMFCALLLAICASILWLKETKTKI